MDSVTKFHVKYSGTFLFIKVLLFSIISQWQLLSSNKTESAFTEKTALEICNFEVVAIAMPNTPRLH